VKFPLVIRNISSITLSQLIIVLSGIILISHLGTTLGPKNFGIYSSAISIYGVSIAIVDLGLSMYGIRYIASKKAATLNLIKKITRIKIFLAILVIAFSGIIFLYINPESIFVAICWLFFTSLIPYAFNLEWVFTGLEKMEIRAFLRTITSIGVLLLCIFFIHFQNDIIWVPIIYFIIASIVAIVSLILTHLLSEKPFFETGVLLEDKTLIISSFPIGLTQILSLFLINADLIVLAFFISPENLGEYAAVSRILSTLISIIGMIFIPLFPAFCRKSRDYRIDHENILEFVIVFIFALSIPIICCVELFTPSLISILYSSHYFRSIMIMQILIWYVPIAIMITILSWFVLSKNEDNSYLQFVIFMITQLVIFMIIGTNLCGIKGTAFSVVISYVISIFILLEWVKNHLGSNLKRIIQFITVFICLGFCCTTISINLETSMVYVVISVIFIYSIFILKYSLIRFNDIRTHIRQIFFQQ